MDTRRRGSESTTDSLVHPPSHCPQHRREHVLASLCLMGLAQYAEWLDQRTQRTSSQQLGGRGHRACHLDFPPTTLPPPGKTTEEHPPNTQRGVIITRVCGHSGTGHDSDSNRENSPVPSPSSSPFSRITSVLERLALNAFASPTSRRPTPLTSQVCSLSITALHS